MKNFTDILINSILKENYFSQAATNEQDRLAVEKAYKDELVNGPKKTITTADGRTFQVGVGSFDLKNMHKAYDDYYEKNNLLKLFDDTGKLVNRGTYGEIKNLNKNEPAVKALLKLWGVQFKNELEFTTENQNKSITYNKAKTKDEERLAKQKAIQIIRDQFSKEGQEQFKKLFTTEWEALLNEYSEKEKKDIKVEVEPEFNWEYSNIVALTINISNIIRDNNYNLSFSVINSTTDISSLINDTLKENEDKIKDQLTKLSNLAVATHYLSKNYEAYLKRPESKIIADFDFLVYLDPFANKLYWARVKELTNNKVMFLTGEDKNSTTMLNEKFRLVAMRSKVDIINGTSYHSKRWTDYFNDTYSLELIRKFKVEIESQPFKNGETGIIITEVTNEYKKFFTKKANCLYELDSSD